jgi:hypothetical protein
MYYWKLERMYIFKRKDVMDMFEYVFHEDLICRKYLADIGRPLTWFEYLDFLEKEDA